MILDTKLVGHFFNKLPILSLYLTSVTITVGILYFIAHCISLRHQSRVKYNLLRTSTNVLEFLTQPKAQALYSSMNYEYPVNPDMKLSDELKSWGEFKEDTLPVEKLAELAPLAQKIIDRVGW